MSDKTADKIGERIKHLTVDLKRYIEKRFELMVISIGEHYSRVVAESLQKIAGLVFLFGALVFLLIALALYLGELLNSQSLGFVIVSVPFLIIGLLFLKLRPRTLTRKLTAGFENELMGMFDTEVDEEEKLLQAEPQELPNKKEQDGKFKKRNAETEKAGIRRRNQSHTGRTG